MARVRFAVGDRVISKSDDWTKGLTGTLVYDESITPTDDFCRVKFEAPNQRFGWGRDDSEFYVDHVDLTAAPKADEISLGTPNLARDLKLPPQARKILAHLLAGKTITPAESLIVYSIYRLSDCILKIRRAGYNVVTEWREDEQGHRYGRYRLQKAA